MRLFEVVDVVLALYGKPSDGWNTWPPHSRERMRRSVPPMTTLLRLGSLILALATKVWDCGRDIMRDYYLTN